LAFVASTDRSAVFIGPDVSAGAPKLTVRIVAAATYLHIVQCAHVLPTLQVANAQKLFWSLEVETTDRVRRCADGDNTARSSKFSWVYRAVRSCGVGL
jgi:hypothetical protein